MPMISRYRRPFTTTPTIPSAMAAITRSRKSAITGSPSPARQAALAARARLVGQAVMTEDSFLVAGGQLAVRADGRGVPDQFPVPPDLHVPRTDGRLVQGHERESVPGRHPDDDRGEE